MGVQGHPQLALKHAAHIVQILNVNGQVKPQFLAQLLHLLLTGLGTQSQPGRIAGHDAGDDKDQHRQTDQSRYGIQETAYQIVAISHNAPRLGCVDT